MPRCGSTLVESILTMNKKVYGLGEINTLEESFIDHNKVNQKLSLAELYLEKISSKHYSKYFL